MSRPSKGARGFSLSYAHEHPNPLNVSAIYGKAPRLTKDFEQNRCPLQAKQLSDLDTSEADRRRAAFIKKRSRRDSDMVARQKPQPVLKPSPQLAHGIDRAAHYGALEAEHRAMRRAQRLERATSKTQHISR